MKSLNAQQIEAVAGARKPPVTTLAIGEEGGTATTLAIGEEGGCFTTLRLGEEGPIFTTLALGEEGGDAAAAGGTSALGSF